MTAHRRVRAVHVTLTEVTEEALAQAVVCEGRVRPVVVHPTDEQRADVEALVASLDLSSPLFGLVRAA